MKNKCVARTRPIEGLTNPRDKGDWAEMMFMAKATSLRFTVCRPYGIRRFDFVVCPKEGQLRRIQVKSAWSKRNGMYRFTTCGGGHRRYPPSEVDFIACYVVPENVWYVIPLSQIRPNFVHVAPHKRGSRARFEQFREAWGLLGGQSPVASRQAAAGRSTTEDTEDAEAEDLIDLPSLDAARWGGYCLEHVLAPAASS